MMKTEEGKLEVNEYPDSRMEPSSSVNVRKLCFVTVIVAQLFLIGLFVSSYNAMSGSKYAPDIRAYSSRAVELVNILKRNFGIDIRTDKGLESTKQLFQNLDSTFNGNKYRNEKNLKLPERLRRLDEHAVFGKFKIHTQLLRPYVHVLLIVSSAPSRIDRRKAIRETWWPFCTSNARLTAKCLFMTDYLNGSTTLGSSLMSEKETHGDVEFQYLQGGLNFGTRYMYHMVWAVKNYDFEYFIRMDDDYFLCAERLFLELPIPSKSLYHWGWVHCTPDIVRPEESIILFSLDLIFTFLEQKADTMYCHPWADQMIGIWVQQLALPKIYRHDTLLHHHPPATFLPEFKLKKNICHNYIGVHGSYPDMQRQLWSNRGDSNYPDLNIERHTKGCHLPQVIKWQNFIHKWRYEPKLCISNPKWDTSKQQTSSSSIYGGRQEANT